MRGNIATVVLVAVVLAILLIHPPPIQWTAAKVIGAALAGISFPFFLWARWQLGASFSVTAQARRLVTKGLYARIRNPIYVFGGLMAAGFSLFLSPWGPLVVAVVLIPLQISRARKEAEVLRAAFGDEYERYRRGTWF